MGFPRKFDDLLRLPSCILLTLILSTAVEGVLVNLQSSHDRRPYNNTISALFIFGDSTVDPGNNNYIKTAFKSDFPPYGNDFVNHNPTGRFTNGRLVTDFIASYAGLKDTIPPYLDPNLTIEELKTGVSFASAGTGYDPVTAQISSVIPVQDQLHYFKEYRARITLAIGNEAAQALISKAAFVISCGTNDFVVNYFSTRLRQYTFTVSDYRNFLLLNLQQLIQGLLAEGAKKIAVVGLPPMGCLPVMITLYNEFGHRQCLDKFSSVARDYNEALKKILNSMQHQYSKSKIVYGDIYDPLDDMITNPQHYGFSNANSGCCGSGFIEAGFLCNQKSRICSDASKNVFWDSIHPTEASYYNLFKALRPTVDIVLKD